MHLRYRFVLPLVALCIALAIPALAAKPAPHAIPAANTITTHKQVGNTTAAAAACQMGILPPAANAFGYILPPDDEYYTYLVPANCPTCPNNAYLFSNAHVQLYYTESCSIPVYVSIVGVDNTDPACPHPNPFDVICPEVPYVLSDGGNIGVCIDYSLPLPAGCCVNRPAFLKFRFEQGTCQPDRPAFCGPPSCQNCRQYNIYPGSPPGGDDLCAVLAPYALYGAIMYVDADCCNATPSLPGTWGHIKTLYR
ncbi:MAG: hypothetical protein HY076_09320 [Candidatus Eisenbacteria bacterium]|uniref:Uncharacterized protein n=1 Tax=Eiseniibacteriota bacterium TaxID=2212470 RepID=A0A9D6QN66_UNCEI|nr:hypothetical protein [Candidatus Eisenbacteria bacterium]MBI3540458.1 hypothetical protein [Candidatus Eisenbacteria bacterium]